MIKNPKFPIFVNSRVADRASVGLYEKEAAKRLARGTRSLQCSKDEQKRIEKLKIPRRGQDQQPPLYMYKNILYIF